MHEPSEERAGALGLIAGAGGLPGEACTRLRAEGCEVRVFGFEGITDFEGIDPEHRTRLGELVRLAEQLERAGVQRLLIVGKFEKRLIFEDTHLLAPDAEALGLLGGIREWSDDGLQGAIADWLERRGFAVLRQDEVLRSMLAQEGLLSRRAPSREEAADAALGQGVVTALGRLGVGQSVALRKGCVLAVEAVEGTDAMIERAGSLGGAGATIVKAGRPGQDRRFDLPAVGPGTISAICEAGATALAVEAGVTLILEAEECLRRADAADLAIWAFAPAEGSGQGTPLHGSHHSGAS